MLLHTVDVMSQGTGVTPDPNMYSCQTTPGPRLVNGVFSPGNTAGAPIANITGGFCGVDISTPGIWWWVNGTGDVLRASTCDDRTNIKVKISVFTGSCNALRCVTGGDTPDFECTSLQIPSSTGIWNTLATAIDFPTFAGQNYYLLVQQTNGSGTVWMNFEKPVIPHNNDCINALGPIPRDNTPILGTTTGSNVSVVSEGYCGAPALYPGVWYQFFGTGGDVTIGACGEFNFDGIYIDVYHGGFCDEKQCLRGTYQDNVKDPAKCSFGAAQVLRPFTTYTVSTNDLDRYFIYVSWARTSGDLATGDFRLYIDDGGNPGSGGAAAIKFAPPGVTSTGGGGGGGKGGKGSGSSGKGGKKKSGATSFSQGYSWILVLCGVLSSVFAMHI